MRKALALTACAMTALAAGVGEARATNECRGLMVCVPVAGPWVVVPATRHVEYQVTCPRRYVVGGLDAELSDRGIDISFPGLLGAPVNPGITTTTNALFAADYTAPRPRVTTFRPHIGCIPTAGGGGTPPHAIWLRPAAFPPGRPVTRRVRNVALAEGTRRVAHACARGERLISASHAIGFHTQVTPAAPIVAAVTSSRTVRNGRVFVRVTVAPIARNARAVVQVIASCAGTGR